MKKNLPPAGSTKFGVKKLALQKFWSKKISITVNQQCYFRR